MLPEPPLLVPELANGATAETAELRAACVAAAARLAAAAPALGRGRRRPGRSAHRRPAARGSFVGFGVDLVVGLDTAGSPARSIRGSRCRC